MGRNLAAVLSVIGSGVAGYMQGKKQDDKDAEAAAVRADERAFLNESRDRERKGWKEQDEIKDVLKTAQSDLAVEEIPSYDLSNMAGEAPAGTPSVGFKANGQTFAGKADAESAIVGLNSRAAKDQRTAAALRERGQIDAARKFEDFAKQAISEGTDQILGAIQASAPSVDAVKKAGGMVAGTVGAGAAEAFNQTGGKWKVTPETLVQHFIDKDAAGREFVNSRVIGKDGKPVVEDAYAAGRMLLSMKERMAQANDDTRTYQSGQQIAETGRHNVAVETGQAEERKAAERARAAQTAQGWAQIGIARQKANLEAQSLKRQTPAGQIALLEEVVGKMSDADKKTFLGITKGKAAPNAAETLADKLTEEYVKANPATPDQIAQFRQDLVTKFSAAKNNGQVETVLKDEFAKLKPGTPDYAKAYAEALSIGATPDALKAMGIAPPAGAKSSPAATMGTGRVPSPPAQKIWVGNSFVLNPAYAEWDKRYGASVRQQEAGENARLTAAMDRARN